MTTYVGFFDGSITHNPGGDIGIGCLLYEVTVPNKQEKIFEHSESFSSKEFPNGTSNNVAEILALNRLLAYLIQEGMTNEVINIFGDSQIIINRANAKKRTGKGMFMAYVPDMIDLIEQFSRIRFVWVKRDKNTEADLLSKVK